MISIRDETDRAVPWAGPKGAKTAEKVKMDPKVVKEGRKNELLKIIQFFLFQLKILNN